MSLMIEVESFTLKMAIFLILIHRSRILKETKHFILLISSSAGTLLISNSAGIEKHAGSRRNFGKTRFGRFAKNDFFKKKSVEKCFFRKFSDENF